MQEPITFLPALELRKYIVSYGVLEIPEGQSEPYFSPPLGLSGMIIHTINTQDKFIAKIGERDFFTEQAVVTGQVTAPVYGEITGHVKLLMIFFQPLGMHQLFGTNMAALTDHSIPLIQFLGRRRANELWNTLKEDQDTIRQTEVLNNFFLSITPVKYDVSQLQRVLDFIHEKEGNVSVKEIESYAYMHRKTIERHFSKMIGISPKVYCQIYRFKCLVNLIQSNPNITWTQLADQAGYYDQSHMSRYIREYLEVSPNSIVTLDMEFIHYLLAQ